MAAVALVNISAFDLTACELLGALDDGCQGMAVVGVSRERLGMQHELAAGRAGIGADDGCLNAELVGRTGLALAMQSTSGAWKEYSFQPRWRCCWERIWLARVSGHSNSASRSALPAILRRMSRMIRPSRMRRRRNWR